MSDFIGQRNIAFAHRPGLDNWLVLPNLWSHTKSGQRLNWKIR